MRSATLTVLTAAALGTSVLPAPVAAAAPNCTNTGPNTTVCQTNGSSQVVTSPPENNSWGGFPFWGGGLVLNPGNW
jgi:hypothetical protein